MSEIRTWTNAISISIIRSICTQHPLWLLDHCITCVHHVRIFVIFPNQSIYRLLLEEHHLNSPVNSTHKRTHAHKPTQALAKPCLERPAVFPHAVQLMVWCATLYIWARKLFASVNIRVIPPRLEKVYMPKSACTCCICVYTTYRLYIFYTSATCLVHDNVYVHMYVSTTRM